MLAGDASGQRSRPARRRPPACGFLLCSGLAVAGSPTRRPSPIASPRANARPMARGYVFIPGADAGVGRRSRLRMSFEQHFL